MSIYENLLCINYAQLQNKTWDTNTCRESNARETEVKKKNKKAEEGRKDTRGNKKCGMSKVAGHCFGTGWLSGLMRKSWKKLYEITVSLKSTGREGNTW